MKWNIEWNDIHNINSILKVSRKMTKQQKKTVYAKLYEQRELRFGSALGEVFLQEYGRIVHGVSKDTLELLESDAEYMERIIQLGMEWEGNIWRDLYELLQNKRKGELVTPLGEKFMEIFQEKLTLEKNAQFQELQHDFRQIEKIYKRVDFENEEKSKKTIKLLAKNEQGIFQTGIGHFFMNQMQKQYKAEDSARKIQRYSLKMLIYILLIGCISCGSIGVYIKVHSANKLHDLQEQKNNDMGENIPLSDINTESEVIITTEETDIKNAGKEIVQETEAEAEKEILPQYQKIADQYPDFWGWIKIPGTKIDYPVMQSKHKDYYLDHDYTGEISREGAVFVDKKSKNMPLDNYVVVYAHNMKTGKMFGALKYYQNDGFFKNHSTIYFDTRYETGEYEVLTILRTHILNQNEKGFRYYQQYGYKDKKTLKQIMDFIRKNAINSGKEIKYNIKDGDQLLLLSTCEYSQENGRFVVVARKVK